MSRVTKYTGPAGIVFTPEEAQTILDFLTLLARAENADIRRRLRAYLEAREEC